MKISSLGQPNIIFHGDRQGLTSCLIFAMVANRWVKGGCEGYLAWVMDSQVTSKKRIEALRVVREYMDVFPDELSGLPPLREVEFTIDLVLGIGPISVSQYRMAPTELKE